MTSAFNERTLQGSMAMGSTQTSFPMPTTYAVPTSESLRTPTELEQNLFDEPFMLDVSINDFEQMAFDDLVASLDKPDAFVRFDPFFLLGVDTDGHVFSTVYVKYNDSAAYPLTVSG
jgi:hypothetical protein